MDCLSHLLLPTTLWRQGLPKPHFTDETHTVHLPKVRVRTRMKILTQMESMVHILSHLAPLSHWQESGEDPLNIFKSTRIPMVICFYICKTFFYVFGMMTHKLCKLPAPQKTLIYPRAQEILNENLSRGNSEEPMMAVSSELKRTRACSTYAVEA